MEENSNNAYMQIKNIIDWFGTIQTAWSIIVLCVLLIGFALCVIMFTKGINEITKGQINRFQKEGKYLPAIYIELNDTMEFLRYFLFSFKWKHRIIRQYNHLFSGYEGQRLKKHLGNDGKYKLSYFSSFDTLIATLSDMHERLESFRKNEVELREKHGEIIWAIRNSTYNHIYAINRCLELCNMINQKNMILVGSAGNGKTSLICRMAEVAMANGMPSLLVNSRDIKENCTTYIINKLPVYPRLKKWSGVYLRLVSLLLAIQRKYFYIFVDAINENDREIFADSLADLLAFFSKYRRVRILLTCRSEYFDSRFKRLFADAEVKPYVFALAESQYDERATKKLITAYMHYYDVKGPFSIEMTEKLRNSLFLTRIFFEVNSAKDECLLEFRNAEIYKLYFEKIAAAHPVINLNNVVNMLSKCMFEKWKFDNIPLDDLHLSTLDTDSLRGLMDNNLIISHSVQLGTGITACEEEYVYFVFDEFRDFCLARYLLTIDERSGSVQFEEFFSKVNQLYEQRLSPVEGITKYAYHYFKISKRDNLCQKILNDFGEKDVQIISDWKEGCYLRRSRTFDNFGFSMIFAEAGTVAAFEREYILGCIEKTPKSFWDVFWYLLKNEYSCCKPNMDLAADLLEQCDEGVIESVLYLFFKDRDEQYYSYRDEKCWADYFAEWIGEIAEHNGTISESIKILVVLLSAFDPLDYALEQYHEFVLEEDVFAKIQSSALPENIKTSVSCFKDRMEPKPTDNNALHLLMEILKAEGYCE